MMQSLENLLSAFKQALHTVNSTLKGKEVFIIFFKWVSLAPMS